ncbi:MAG: cupin domain-containing protein [Pseudomonadota bacterium]
MTTQTVIRLFADGPPGIGLEKLPIDPADFQTAPTEQTWHVYFEDKALNLAVGIWTTTDMQEPFGPYPGDEFMVVLKGRVEMMNADGTATPVETGQGFGVRNGVPLSWKQTGFLKKAFILMSYDESKAADGQGVFVAPSEADALPLQDAEDQIGGGEQREAAIYKNDTGNMEAGIWESSAFNTDLSPFSVHEFAHIIEGAVTITDQDGNSQRFEAGESLFTPAGTVCSWASDGPVRKFYAIVTP